jgi:GNAT superfamily N-acetyltransferase
VNLRPGTVADAEYIARLVASFQREVTTHPDGAGAEHYLAAVSPQAERAYLESDRYSFIVAEDEDVPLGFIALRDTSHVFHLFVAREHQRKGVARRLWQEAMTQVLKHANPSHFTVNSSLGAVAVYRAFGFEPTDEVTSVHGISFLPMQLTVPRE